jgi:hypothetical protein
MTFSDDGSLAQAKGLLHFDEMFAKTLARMGENPQTTSLLGQFMTDGGFQNISVIKRKLPFSAFSDELDMKEIAHDSSEFHKMDAAIIAERGLQPMLNLSSEQVRAVLANTLHDICDTKIHAYRHG